MDVTGRWYFASWLGGGCTLATGEDSDADGGDDSRVTYSVLYSQGKLKILLHCCSDGWWEGPPDSGLRVCRYGSYLVLQRRKGANGHFRQVRAATSAWGAACLCYKSTLQSIFLITTQDVLPVPVPETAPPPAKEENSMLPPAPQPVSPPQESEDSALPLSEKEEEDDDFWPEPEAEGLPEQPSTAHEQSALSLLMSSASPDVGLHTGTESEELPDTISDEKLLQHPQVVSYCLGVTSLSHSHAAKADRNVIQLGMHVPETMPHSEISSLTESIPHSSDTSDVNLNIVEERQGLERVVAEVTDLCTTVHGLLTVPEDAELPDVPSPIAPSKSDSAILHGSVSFDGDLSSWLRENHEIPDEAKFLCRETNHLGHSTIELGMSLSHQADALGNIPELGDPEPNETDLRPRLNPLVRSHEVSSSSSDRSAAMSQFRSIY